MKNQTSHQNRQPIRHSTTPPRIFIAIQYLEIGGAERSLIGLLNTLDYSRCQVDLFVYRHSGEFMSLIPKEVNLLPEVKKYTTLTRPIREIICEGYWDIAAGRITAHLLDWRYRKRTKAKESQAIFQYVANCTTPFLPSINENWTYDLAISFLTPHNIVRDKVKAQQKWAWIHTDYSFIGINTRRELPVWEAFDRIISISESVSKGFLSKFPSLKCKLMVMENILSETFIREQAELPFDTSFLQAFEGREGQTEHPILLCTVGRFSYPKAIDRAVYICRQLVQQSIDVCWYVVGYGGDGLLIRKAIAETGMEKHFVLVGKQINPYPYIKACDIYVQPSRYEGKAVTVREAQILGKSVAITRFPTSSSQLEEGVDGIIIPNNAEGAAEGLAQFIADKQQQEAIKEQLRIRHYGNEKEVDKIYSAIEG